MHRAILIMLVAMSLIPLGDTAGKLMINQSALSPFFAAWSRFAVGALILAFFVRGAVYKLLLDWRIIARASILVCGITSILTALSTVPIATVYAVFFHRPFDQLYPSCSFSERAHWPSAFGVGCRCFYRG